jgi:hypothetical protein
MISFLSKTACAVHLRCWLGLGTAVVAVGVYFFRAYGKATHSDAEKLVVGLGDPSGG